MRDRRLPILIIILLLVINVSANYYNLDINQEGKKASINESFNLNDNITSNFLDTEIIDNSGNNYYFTYKVTPKVDNNISIRMFLSEGFGVSESDIYPKNFNLETDGHKIIVIWHFDNLLDSKDIPLFVKFSSPNNLPITIKIIIVIIALLLIVALVILFLKYGKAIEAKKNKKDKGLKANKVKIKDFTSYLSDGEKIVVELLRKNDKEMWQKDIQRDGNFSKARLSRIIRNLEAKSIINRTPIGNTNKIKLKK